MKAYLGFAAALLLIATSVRAQSAANSSEPAYMDSVSGTISATLASGATLRGAGATVYLWAATPDMRAVLDAACSAARVRPDSWITARTELESPSGLPLDSIVAADLAILRRLADVPHAVARADSVGRFSFIDVPFGTFWISAEMLENGRVVQWWHNYDLGRTGFALAKLFGQQSPRIRLQLGTPDFTHDEFCTGGEPALGAAEFEVGRREHHMSSTSSDSAYVDPDQQAEPLDRYSLSPDYPADLRKAAVEGSVTARFVVDSSGVVDMRTLRIVSSTDFRFSNAVRDRLSSARFRPARIDGHPVRWAVEQQFTFSLH